MAHPLANDPKIPAALRNALNSVKEQIVRVYADGSEWSYNVNPRGPKTAAQYMERERSVKLGSIDPIRGEVVDVFVRPI